MSIKPHLMKHLLNIPSTCTLKSDGDQNV